MGIALVNGGICNCNQLLRLKIEIVFVPLQSIFVPAADTLIEHRCVAIPVHIGQAGVHR